jgi:hypothetical protein
MKKLSAEFKIWFHQHRILGSLGIISLLTLLAFIITSIIGGMLGNAVYDWLKTQNGQISLVWWLLILILLAPVGILLLITSQFANHLMGEKDNCVEDAEVQRRNYSSAIDRMRAWGLAQHTALKLVATVKADENILADDERDFKNLIRAYLDKAVEVIGEDICRAVVLKPTSDGKQLVPWEWSKKMADPLERVYELGDDDTEGTAGYVFRRKELIKGKMVDESGVWTSTAAHYRFSPRRNTDTPNYMSLVVTPLIDPDHRCWGVLCLDSKTSETFDNGELVNTIQELADGLAAGISTYANFKTAAEAINKANANIDALQKEILLLKDRQR